MVGGRVKGPRRVRGVRAQKMYTNVNHLFLKRGVELQGPRLAWVWGKSLGIRPSPLLDVRESFCNDWEVQCRLKSSFLFLPFEEVKQDQKNQQEPVGMGSEKPVVSTVIG